MLDSPRPPYSRDLDHDLLAEIIEPSSPDAQLAALTAAETMLADLTPTERTQLFRAVGDCRARGGTAESRTRRHEAIHVILCFLMANNTCAIDATDPLRAACDSAAAEHPGFIEPAPEH